MNESMPKVSTPGLPDEQDRFLLQLPEWLAAVERGWSSLRAERWDKEQLNALYRQLRDISAASSPLGLYQLNEGLFSLEVYLSSFVGTGEKPDQGQFETIDELLRNLQATAQACLQDKPRGARQQGQTTFFLKCGASTELEALQAALVSHEADSKVFEQIEGLLNAMLLELPACIVVDTADLPNLQPLSAEIGRIGARFGVDIPLVFTSSSNNLQLHVDAARAGGVAYMLRPLDAQAVARQILEICRPDAERPFRIMVVEDDPTQAEAIATVLGKAGMAVLAVTEPLRVLERLQEDLPELILLDRHMPEINGVELARVIREYDEYLGIPILLLSAEQGQAAQTEALEAGADDLIAKPVLPKQLLASVSSRVRRARRLLQTLASPRGRTEQAPSTRPGQRGDRPLQAGDTALHDEGFGATIRECLSTDGFVLRYQPLLDLESRGSESYDIQLDMPLGPEQLLDEDEVRGSAEKAGLSGELDRWLLDQAIKILMQRQQSGRQTRLFVRQSASSLLDPNHPAWLLGRLRTTQVVGTGLVLDFRLSDLSRDIKAAKNTIAALREFDVQVALSRFPEKHAAFQALRFVDARYIKVSPRLLQADPQVISGMVDQAHKAGAKIVLSHVDDPRAIDLHWSTGADYLQGDLIQPHSGHMDYDFSQVVA